MKKIFSIITLSILLSSCSRQKPAEKEPATKAGNDNAVTLTAEQFKNAGLTIVAPVNKEIHTVIKINGQVDVPPQSMVSVSFPLGGYLKSSHLLPGTSVQKGEVIATMEDQSYVQLQQDYLVAKAKMEYLDADIRRQKELSDHEAASKKNYQMVLSDFKIQQAMIKGLEEKLQIIGINPEKLNVGNVSRIVSLRSPINGYVTKVNVNIGRYVNPSDVLFELVNPDDIHAAMTVFEKDIDVFKKGVKGKVSLADQPAKQYDVEVILVTKNINDNRTGTIHCHFEKPNHQLLPGMFLSGSFELSNQSATVVPEDALVRYGGRQYVFVANGHYQFEMKEVETGGSENGFIEIKARDDDNWLTKKVAAKNTYALLGKLKNKVEE